MLRWLIPLCLVLLSPVAAQGQPAMPRVLILGDSVYRQPAIDAAKFLKGKIEVVYPAMQPGEIRNSSTVLENLDKWVGDEHWDVIHINVGLGDLIHRAPGMKSFRVLPRHAGGVRATSPQQYEKNLRELVRRLQNTKAKLIWASTTPIRHSATDVFEMRSEIAYNAIAAKVMKQHNIPINDMYSHVKALMNMDKPASHGADPFHFDRKPIHPPMVQAILAALNETDLKLTATD